MNRGRRQFIQGVLAVMAVGPVVRARDEVIFQGAVTHDYDRIHLIEQHFRGRVEVIPDPRWPVSPDATAAAKAWQQRLNETAHQHVNAIRLNVIRKARQFRG